jgi:hypothetical protein
LGKVALALCIAAMFCAPGGPLEAGVIVVVDPGLLHQTDAITTEATSGDDMDGMAVTAWFSNGASDTVAWADTGAGSGGVVGSAVPGWSLSVSGDTFTANWGLANNTNLGLTTLALNGTPGQTVFDMTTAGFGTPGSFSGKTFPGGVSVPGDLDITCTYANTVALTGNPPVGDIYTTVRLQFTNSGGFGSGRSMEFEMDTDNGTTEFEVIPEPTTLSLLGLGGLGILIRRRRKR